MGAIVENLVRWNTQKRFQLSSLIVADTGIDGLPSYCMRVHRSAPIKSTNFSPPLEIGCEPPNGIELVPILLINGKSPVEFGFWLLFLLHFNRPFDGFQLDR